MKRITSALAALTVFSSALCASAGDQYIGVQNIGISYKLDFSEETAIQGIIGKVLFNQDFLLKLLEFISYLLKDMLMD